MRTVSLPRTLIAATVGAVALFPHQARASCEEIIDRAVDEATSVMLDASVNPIIQAYHLDNNPDLALRFYSIFPAEIRRLFSNFAQISANACDLVYREFCEESVVNILNASIQRFQQQVLLAHEQQCDLVELQGRMDAMTIDYWMQSDDPRALPLIRIVNPCDLDIRVAVAVVIPYFNALHVGGWLAIPREDHIYIPSNILGTTVWIHQESALPPFLVPPPWRGVEYYESRTVPADSNQLRMLLAPLRLGNFAYQLPTDQIIEISDQDLMESYGFPDTTYAGFRDMDLAALRETMINDSGVEEFGSIPSGEDISEKDISHLSFQWLIPGPSVFTPEFEAYFGVTGEPGLGGYTLDINNTLGTFLESRTLEDPDFVLDCATPWR